MKQKSSQYSGLEGLLLPYYKGKLNEEEQEAVKAALESSEDLRKEAHFVKQLVDVAEDESLIKSADVLLRLRREKLATIQNTATLNKGVIPTIRQVIKKRPFTFLLFLVLIVVVLLVVNNILFIADSNHLYKKHLRPYDSIVSTDAATRPALLAAIEAYEQGKIDREYYAEASHNFEKIKDEDPLFKFYAVVSGMLSADVDIDLIEQNLVELRVEFKQNEQRRYRHFLDWVNYYEALLEFKKNNFKLGKQKIIAIQSSPELDSNLRTIVSRFRNELRLFITAK